MAIKKETPEGPAAWQAPALQAEWVSNDIVTDREAFATIRNGYQVNLNVLATREAMAVFGMAGSEPMPKQVSAGWVGFTLVISPLQFPGTVPYTCRWARGDNPALTMSLGRVLKKRNVRAPNGFLYRVRVSTITDSPYGPLVALDMTHLTAEAAAPRSTGKQRDQQTKAAPAQPGGPAPAPQA